jgi:hypothetical protein
MKQGYVVILAYIIRVFRFFAKDALYRPNKSTVYKTSLRVYSISLVGDFTDEWEPG